MDEDTGLRRDVSELLVQVVKISAMDGVDRERQLSPLRTNFSLID